LPSSSSPLSSYLSTSFRVSRLHTKFATSRPYQVLASCQFVDVNTARGRRRVEFSHQSPVAFPSFDRVPDAKGNEGAVRETLDRELADLRVRELDSCSYNPAGDPLVTLAVAAAVVVDEVPLDRLHTWSPSVSSALVTVLLVNECCRHYVFAQ